MEYGYFDDAQREFVVTSPKTPFPWINYLGNEDFFSLISNTAGGYCFYRDAKFRRIIRYRYNGVPMDNGGRYFYIKDGDTLWNPGWKPCKTPLDRYEARHGMGYTRITGEKNGIEASALFFVPLGMKAEVQHVRLTNRSQSPRMLQLFSFVEWCLWNAQTDMENFQRNWSTGEVEVSLTQATPATGAGNCTIYHKTEYKERRNHYAYYSVNCAVQGYDTDRESFLGLYNDFSEPEAVLAGKPTCSIAHGWSPIASHCIEVELAPGESRDFIFLLGYEENAQDEKFDAAARADEDRSRRLLTSLGKRDHHIINKTRAREVIERFRTTEAVEAALDALRQYWDDLLGRFSVQATFATGVGSTADAQDGEKLGRMVNIWNQYQCMITFNLSRSASFFESGIGRGMGFRDSNQDLLGFVHQVPGRARQRILDIAATQFPDGGCYHQYQPLTKRGNNDIGGGFNDDPMWLILGTVAYVKETGDTDILAEMVPFDNQHGTEVTLMEHLRVSFNHVPENLGPHGLPLIGRADWNDCLNLNCFSMDPNESFQTTGNKTEGSKAESLMIAGLFVYAGREYAALCRHLAQQGTDIPGLDLNAEAQRATAATAAMTEAVVQHGWDGDWYLRAYDFNGCKVGSRLNEEGKIFIESQGWCAMAQIGREAHMPQRALDSAKLLLDSEHGLVLNYPAYTRYRIELGEQSTYPAGYKENGGIFCHNNPWVIIGETLCGRGNDAWEHYTKIAPAWIRDQKLHRTEPYVYCQCLAGKEAARPGEGKNSWLTGTAAWNWVTVTQHILGIQPTYGGLMVNPCIPATMQQYTVTRRFRDAEYVITVHNPQGKQHADAPVFIPYAAGRHEVSITL